jgi:hypothetical protein
VTGDVDLTGSEPPWWFLPPHPPGADTDPAPLGDGWIDAGWVTELEVSAEALPPVAKWGSQRSVRTEPGLSLTLHDDDGRLRPVLPDVTGLHLTRDGG